MQTIFQWLSIYKIKSGSYPTPDNSIEITAGNHILTYQWEIGKNIKISISLQGN